MQNGGEAAALAAQQAQMQATRDVNNELEQLETELAQVEAQIAEFDRMNPGIASGDIDIAATMMEAGNIAPYQQAVNTEIGRRQMNASGRDAAESAVRNAIANAKKLEWGLHEADDWMQRKTRGEMKAALDDAKYVAEKNGMALPREYYDLLKKVDEGAANDTGVGGGDTVLADTQRIEGLVRNKNLHDKDIRELYAKADKMGDNSSEAAKLRALADKYKNSTVEKRAAGEQEKAEAGREASKINGVKNKDMRRQMFDNGSDALRTYYKYDEKSGLVVKVGK
jgi:hypothetical protein